jgi:hypothetical protein
MKRYLLSGCLVGAGLIAGCATIRYLVHHETYERAISPSTSHSNSWEKAGVREEQKRDDWIACGGKKTGFLSRRITGSPMETLVLFGPERTGNFSVV